ncbi:AraC family transcriptional regulator [Zobellia sp.]|nr:AraC family transcriptional regulator [Zobellia sp.]
MEDFIRTELLLNKKNSPFFMRPLLQEKNRNRKHRDPHRHNYNEIIYFKSGEALQNIDDKIVNLKTTNTFYLIGKGQIHDFIKGKNMQGYLIRFDNELIPIQKDINNSFYLSILESISKKNMIVLDKKDVQIFENILDSLYHEYSEKPKSDERRHIVVNLLLVLLSMLQRKSKSLNNDITSIDETDEKKVCYKFLKLLESNYVTQQNVDFYAEHLGLSNRKLSEITLSVKGVTCKKLILDRVLTEAKRLLLYTQISTKEISYILGFDNPSYFNRLFKAKIGSTPNNYKKKVLDKENVFFSKE